MDPRPPDQFPLSSFRLNVFFFCRRNLVTTSINRPISSPSPTAKQLCPPFSFLSRPKKNRLLTCRPKSPEHVCGGRRSFLARFRPLVPFYCANHLTCIELRFQIPLNAFFTIGSGFFPEQVVRVFAARKSAPRRPLSPFQKTPQCFDRPKNRSFPGILLLEGESE